MPIPRASRTIVPYAAGDRHQSGWPRELGPASAGPAHVGLTPHRSKRDKSESSGHRAAAPVLPQILTTLFGVPAVPAESGRYACVARNYSDQTDASPHTHGVPPANSPA